MTGCPNGCARPYLAEIGLVGKALGRYNLYLGAGFAGNRLNRLVAEGQDEAAILEYLRPLLSRYATERMEVGARGRQEHFGDWLLRAGIVEPVLHGRCSYSTGPENDLTSPPVTPPDLALARAI